MGDADDNVLRDEKSNRKSGHETPDFVVHVVDPQDIFVHLIQREIHLTVAGGELEPYLLKRFRLFEEWRLEPTAAVDDYEGGAEGQIDGIVGCCRRGG
jgi:hypothetical protein